MDLPAAQLRRIARRPDGNLPLPPGTYATSVISAGLGADGPRKASSNYDRTFTGDEATWRSCSTRTTALFDYDSPRCCVNDGGILESAGRARPATPSSPTTVRPPLRPAIDSVTGPADHPTLAANWWLSQPTTGKAPKYMYDLLNYWNGYRRATLDGTSTGTSKLVHYNGMGSTRPTACSPPSG